jgi:Mn2+/Fe2+ NRAMP family transporter
MSRMSLRRFFHTLGPGLITGASDDDPSGIATYTQAGAAFGLGTIWLMLFTVPLMAAVQEACARLSLVTRRGLVRQFAGRVPRPVLWIGVAAFVLVNAFNLGADLGMMASSAQLLWPLPAWLFLGMFVLLTLGLQIFLDYRHYAEVLKWLSVSLFAYVIVAFAVHVNWFDVTLATFVPHLTFTKDYFLLLVALLGTTISPYLFVWQSAQEVEEDRGDHESIKNILFRRRQDVSLGMTLSNLISWFIILTAASVLFAHGLSEVTSPADAAKVLEPVAGEYAAWLFALGVIGTGLLAVPILSGSAAYAIAEAANLKRVGLSKTWKQAPFFYLMVILITVLGALTPFLGLNPIKMLIYAAVGNALLAPFMLWGILRLTEDKKLMGEWSNGPFSRVLLWTTFLAMSGSLVLWAWLG